MIRAALIFLVLLAPAHVWAKVEVMQFDTPEQEETYNKMIAELRCLVCQNQNLADSNAELAVDMRRKTHEMVMQNKSDKEIAAFMVERYGDFVLYRPPFNTNTLLLWLGPFLILLVGVTLLIRTVLNRRAAVEPDVDDARLKAAATLLDPGTDKRDA
jgi:cytochrome c-type biogenesis protein CcmH